MDKASYPLIWIPLLPLLGAAFNLLVGRVLFKVATGRPLPRSWVHFVAVASVAAAFGVSLWLVGGPLWEQFKGHGGEGILPGLDQNLYTWIEVGRLKIDLAFRLDTLSAVMILIVTFVGTLIHIYSTGYMAEEPRYANYFGYLNLFTGAMLILVLGDNLPVMFIGWEGVGLCSYLLIGFWFTNEAYAYAGRKAFIVNRIGDFAFLLGMFLLFWATGTLSFQDFQSAEAMAAFESSFFGGERLAFFAGLLLFIGATGKSAQIPLYVWLPDAMAGPTPVSALIHAATMVTAGVYMIARLSFLYASSTTAMAVVAGVGALTALFAAIMAFAQTDLKKVLAYSTVSQLGFMFVGVGVGAYVGGIFHLLTHAFFKAGLFLGAGSVMHAMSGSGDITKMGGLRKKLPWTHVTFLVYCLAIAGVFPFAGFFSKDEILAGAFMADGQGWIALYGEILWAVLSVAALGTAFYMFRLYFLVFAGECRADDDTRAHIHESPPSMWVPLAILAAFTFVLGAIGLPHSWGVPNALEHWLSVSLIGGAEKASRLGLAELPHLSGGATNALMGVALVVGLIGIGAAYAIYGKGPSAAVARITSGGFGAAVHKVVSNKFYVDELYDLIIVRPFRWLAAVLAEVDRVIIDLAIVDGVAFLVSLAGRVARWFQNGQVQRYLVGLVIGGAAIFYFASRPSAEFDYRETAPNQVAFEAVLEGPEAQGASVEWDFDGDGRVDSQEPQANFSYASAGTYEVTMVVKEPIFGRTAEVKRSVVVSGGAAPAEAGGER